MLRSFRGDLDWIHAEEDYRGAKSCYWPGGKSGITLRPGVDLGHADPDLIESAYHDLLSTEQWQAVMRAMGIKGHAASHHLTGNKTLASIRISWEAGGRLFEYVSRPYWDAIRRRFPALSERTCPSAVQTALLSIAFNRGAGNRALSVLGEPLEAGNYSAVASIIANMQQNHPASIIRRRRKSEAALITAYFKAQSKKDKPSARRRISLVRPTLRALERVGLKRPERVGLRRRK